MEGSSKDPIAPKVLQQETQARYIIYKHLHDDDLKKLVGLKYAKEMWEKLESIFGYGTSRNKEFEKPMHRIIGRSTHLI